MSALKNFNFQDLKGVLVDFDNTLYEYSPCHEAGLKAVYNKYKEKNSISYDDFLLLYSHAQKKVKMTTSHQAASHSRFLYFQKLLEDALGKTEVVDTIAFEEIYWRSFEEAIILRKELVDFLILCRQKGIKVCLITDLTASVQFRKMVATGVDKLVDFVVTSEESGVEKPDQAIFMLALSKLGLSPEDVVMIGDDKIKDIDGAHKLGIKGYLV